MNKKTEVIPITNKPIGKPILDGNPVFETDYLVKMLRKTDFHSIEKLYCYLDEHDHDNDRLEILIDLSRFWMIMAAQSQLEDPDWWGHHDVDALGDVEADQKGYTESCTIPFKVLHNKGHRVSIAVYDYNSMNLRMAHTSIDPVIDPAKCMVLFVYTIHYF